MEPLALAADEPVPESDDISQALFQEAARWLARLREPDADARIKRQFQQWYDRDSRNRLAYAEAERLWTALGAPSAQSAIQNEVEISALVAKAAGRGSSRPVRSTVAGMAVAALLVAGGWWYHGGLDDLRSTYVTAPGTRRHYVLEDGTALDLNTDTALAVDMQPDRRIVRMFRGEAFFSVTHDTARPFIVVTPDGDATDIGTAFNVRIRAEGSVVSLMEGKVGVAAGGNPASRADLDPGQEVEMARSSVGPVKTFEAAAITAWRNGRVIFFRTPLGEVVDELNRYQRGRILILNDSLRMLPVTGAFSTADPQEAIRIVEATLGVSAIHLTSALTVLR